MHSDPGNLLPVRSPASAMIASGYIGSMQDSNDSGPHSKSTFAGVTEVPPLNVVVRESANRRLSPGGRLTAEALVVVYIAAIAELARFSGIPYLLFPELGALAYDVLIRPWGKWASQPFRLILTPAITALIGTLVTRHLPFSGFSVVIIAGSSAVVLLALRSSIAPAMSAGVLPLVLGLKSWLYPPSILLTLAALAAISVVWRRYHSLELEPSTAATDVEDVLESAPRGWFWGTVLLVFVALMAEIARISGLRFILFPPLVTMAYEMFGHPETCPWTKRPLSLPISCFIVALSGLLAFHIFGAGIGLAITSVVIGIVVLRSFDLHMPPAMAVGLLPIVMTSPNWKFPFAVLAGTVGLTAGFLLYQGLGGRAPKSTECEG